MIEQIGVGNSVRLVPHSMPSLHVSPKMKNLFHGMLLVVLLAGCGDIDRDDPRIGEDQLPSDLTREEEALLRDVRQMFEHDDISGMMDRVHNAGVADDFWLGIQEDYLR